MRVLGLACLVVLLWAGGAQARREQTYGHSFFRVWTSVVRMLRVDFESPITEKDKDSGYFLFDFPDGSKTHPGSVEVFKVVENGLEHVRVVIQIPALASYVEQMLLDRLERKLSSEFGVPPVVKTAPKAKPGPAPAEPARPEPADPSAKPEAKEPAGGSKSENK